ncbi:MAG: tripartite tricarboxylate transporter substrate-binding protein [Bacillota bacterium]
MFKKKGLLVLLAVLLMVSLVAGCGQKAQEPAKKNEPAASEPAKVENKDITLIVPNSPGKGMDTYARMIVPYIEKHYPGAKITVKNIVGAGGVVGTNQLWQSKPDGLTIAFTSFPSILLADLSGAEGVQFKATELTYLGRASTEPRVFAVGGKSPFNKIEDLAKAGRPIKFPSQGMDEDFFTAAVMAKSFGFELVQITGYEGNADTALAVIKGEGDGHITALGDADPMIKAGDKKPLLMFASERVKEYPDVPTALELTSGENKEFMLVLTNMIEAHRTFFGPPNMDQKATEELRTAISKALSDPELIEKAKQANNPITAMDGAKLQEKVNELAAGAEKIKPTLKEAVASIK